MFVCMLYAWAGGGFGDECGSGDGDAAIPLYKGLISWRFGITCINAHGTA